MSETVEKALKVLETLSAYDTPIRLADLSRELKMNKSTTYRMLEVMNRLGYVQQDEPNGRYMITTKMWEIGMRAFQRLDIRACARPYLEQIGRETSETAVLALIDNNEVMIVEKYESTHAIQAFSPLGSRSPLHCSSLGKAYLMINTDEKIRNLKKPLQAFTDKTITAVAGLKSDIAAANMRGVAMAYDEFDEGVSGISAAVLGADCHVHAVMGVTVPTMRMLDEDHVNQMMQIIKNETEKLSRALGYNSATMQ